MKVIYTTGSEELLDELQPFWEMLTAHHQEKSVYFKQHFAAVQYADRKARFLKKTVSGKLRVEFAKNADSGEVAGYCVSSIDDDKIGDVESLYIKPEYRRQGIGEQLMHNALNWLDEQGSIKKTLSVAYGNEQVFDFYAKFGFYPRKTELEQLRGGSL
ncbi:MAG: GNAT family N-acetyltransferase [Negativicutes bacterium]